MNKIKKRLRYSYTAAFAGFIFGFDTIVISGVDQKLQDLWQSTDLFHGLVVIGMALWGTVIGAIFGRNVPFKRVVILICLHDND